MTTTAPTQLSALPRLVSRLVRRYHPVEVVLFGSCARGEAGPNSDVDLLLVVDTVQEQHARATVTAALGDGPVAKDVVVTTPERLSREGHLRGLVYRNALREGRRLYRRRGARTPWWEKAREGTMTPEEVAAEARRWLKRAQTDLVGAAGLLELDPGLAGNACFLAQQVAEKALKAALIYRGIDPPRTHDLKGLRGLLGDDAMAASWPDVSSLTVWVVQGRYPDPPEPTPSVAQPVVALSREFVARVAEALAREGLANDGV
ncbi:MAG: HEPN domain-containing protein [Chloroflexota bacterium]|nr:MAG: HEPN domain-containing protein [Chloroflexota bacterium]